MVQFLIWTKRPMYSPSSPEEETSSSLELQEQTSSTPMSPAAATPELCSGIHMNRYLNIYLKCNQPFAVGCILNMKMRSIPAPPISVSLVSSVTEDGWQSASFMLWKGCLKNVELSSEVLQWLALPGMGRRL
ncbi:uncharacterized protein LOC125544306 isoform X2 [Triticum urartu]|uniref:uncharacterized protein LOC125544306 isoform X2 n=1 Tax=Triticum urartu TaxID=4572 RepID=UPI0020441D60|nr:uncharacterized protein LOC125544306 isoform X2 [Triticum urartu]